jgi:hypothetical protein
MRGTDDPLQHRQLIDDLMCRLYRLCRGRLHQTLVANYSVADHYRNLLDPTYTISRRPIVKAAQASWRFLAATLGIPLAIRIGLVFWTLVGIPFLLMRCFRLGPDSYIWQGDANARVILLRTGVANEPAIARWAAQKEGEAVLMLQYNQRAPRKISNLLHFPAVLKIHLAICHEAADAIQKLAYSGEFSQAELNGALPAWFVLFARHAESISWNHYWAKVFLAGHALKAFYFTFNYANENAFRLALPKVPASYVEHGFPRRDILPLPCCQYVYSEGYARYLRIFEPELNVTVIGLEYFDKGRVEPARTIVVASLQDWPHFKVRQVQLIFNQALAVARRAGWKLVFRTRGYDTDAFANALDGSWDEISQAENETFHECLERTRPAMVWTTWSTAILDACASSVTSVAFVTDDLNNHFNADLDSFAFVVNADGNSYQILLESLQQTDVESAKRLLELHYQKPNFPASLAALG